MGAALRAARRAAGVRRRDAAGRVGLKTAALRNYERGSEPVPDDVAGRLADAYDCDVSTLLPNRDVAPVILEPGYLRVGPASKTLRSDDPHPDEVLKGYLSLLYDMRDLKPGTRIPLRDHDLDALAEALGGTSDAIEARLIELMHVTRDEAAAMTATLLRRRFVVPAAGLIFGAGLLTGAVKLTDEHGSQARTTPTAIGAPASVSRDDVTIGTAARVGRVVDLATIAATPTRVTPANVTPSPEVVMPSADVVTPVADVVAPPAAVESSPACHRAAPPTSRRRARGRVRRRACGRVHRHAADDVDRAGRRTMSIAPADDVVAPVDEVSCRPMTWSRRRQTMWLRLPSDEVVAPSDDVVAPPSDEVVAPPGRRADTPADDVLPPAADDVTPPPDDAVVPTDDAIPAECPPELLQQADQNTLSQIRDTDYASESDTRRPQPTGLTQQRLSTGTRINTAQDDPTGLGDQADDNCDAGDQALLPANDCPPELLGQANDSQQVLQLLRGDTDPAAESQDAVKPPTRGDPAASLHRLAGEPRAGRRRRAQRDPGQDRRRVRSG